MKPSSSQQWAIGAITMTTLIACSPQVDPPLPAPETPSTAVKPAAPAPALAIIETPAQPPGYTGIWALADGDCSDPAKALNLSGRMISLTPGGKSCGVKSLKEEHPTGRSMIYHIMADCGGGTQDMVTLNFGASDTVVQMKVNDREPVRLVRCPTAETP